MSAEVFQFPKAANFEQAKPDQVQVFRHARARRRVGDKWVGYSELNDVEPRGGVTFLFEIDYPTNTLSFAVTACHPDENFNRLKADDKVTKMFNNGCVFVGSYDRDISLVHNAYNILNEVFFDRLPVRGYTEYTIGQIGGQLDYILKKGYFDPAFVNIALEIRIPITKQTDFDRRIQAIIQEYNDALAGEKAA